MNRNLVDADNMHEKEAANSSTRENSTSEWLESDNLWRSPDRLGTYAAFENKGNKIGSPFYPLVSPEVFHEEPNLWPTPGLEGSADFPSYLDYQPYTHLTPQLPFDYAPHNTFAFPEDLLQSMSFPNFQSLPVLPEKQHPTTAEAGKCVQGSSRKGGLEGIRAAYNAKSCPEAEDGEYQFKISNPEHSKLLYAFAMGEVGKEAISEELVSKCFKMEWCQITRTHNWRSCPFAHGPNDVRRDLERVKYQPSLCPNWEACGRVLEDKYEDRCPYGTACKYAHGPKEYFYHPKMFRKVQCAQFRRTGQCDRLPFCSFKHETNRQ